MDIYEGKRAKKQAGPLLYLARCRRETDIYTRVIPTTAGSTPRLAMLGSRVEKNGKSSHSTGVGDAAVLYLAIGEEADRRVVELERCGRSPTIYEKTIMFPCDKSLPIGV